MDLIQTTFMFYVLVKGQYMLYSLIKLIICGDLFRSKSKGIRKIYTWTIVSSTKVQIGPNALALGLAWLEPSMSCKIPTPTQGKKQSTWKRFDGKHEGHAMPMCQTTRISHSKIHAQVHVFHLGL